jgi:GMP synthase-like glutamine amidotransferase
VIAGDMLGAKTYIRERNWELGVYHLEKTQAAREDIFLGPISEGMPIVCGHVKYFEEVPPGTELLLYTNEYGDQVPVHAFKVKGAPFYAFQGHLEISCEELYQRVAPMLYRQHYFPPKPGNAEHARLGYNPETYDEFCNLKTDTSEAQGLLKRFVKMVEEGQFGQRLD